MSLNLSQFEGWLPLKNIKPTEASVVEREPGSEGVAYRNEMLNHVREHGFTMGPLEVDYVKRFRSSRTEQPWLMQGHHRHWVAQQLKKPYVPVRGRGLDRAPGFTTEDPYGSSS